jgi:hypothetical protein
LRWFDAELKMSGNRMTHLRHPGSVRNIVLGSLAVVCALVGSYLFVRWIFYPPQPKTFDGPSTDLHDLVVVPTLDTPAPVGKSVLWCSSFQLAWNQLRNDIVNEPVRLANAQEIADRLNRAPQSVDDIAPDSVFAVAGFERDGIREKIRLSMAQRFPGSPIPAIPGGPDAIVAFAHLAADVKYQFPFHVWAKPLSFVDSRGRTTPVRCFGIPPFDYRIPEEVVNQVRVLFAPTTHGQLSEFAIDLSSKSQPNQIVLALLKPALSLTDTLAEVQKRIDSFQARIQLNPKFKDELLHHDERVLVPAMNWRIAHGFSELEGPDKSLLNDCCRKQFIAQAYQDIEFKLDANGATVSSNAHLAVTTTMKNPDLQPRPDTAFFFDRPFLIYLKKRDAKHPFFVMWVNDAELLQPAPPEKQATKY